MNKKIGYKKRCVHKSKKEFAMVMLILVVMIVLPGFMLCGHVQAADYPTRSVAIVVPFSAGAATDMVARVMAEELSIKWKQPVNVIDMPGGRTVPGVQYFMSAAPDGYTILADTNVSSASQLGEKGLPYDVLNRIYLARIAVMSQTFIVEANSPWRSLKDIAEAGRKNPASIVWGAAAGGKGGNDIAQMQFLEAAGIDITRTSMVSFDGGTPCNNAVAGGHIRMTAGSPAGVISFVTSGKVKALAVTAPAREKLLPSVPTSREAGFPAVNYHFWVGFSGPPGLPSDVVNTFLRTVEEILKDPKVIDRFETKLNMSVAFISLDAFKGFMLEDARIVEHFQEILRKTKR